MGEILPDGSVQGWTCGCGASVGFQGHDCEWRREQERVGHLHVCRSCSPNRETPGPGCVNCRQTGYDQTPCVDCPGKVSADGT